MKKEKQSAQVSASDAPAKDVAQVIKDETKLPENGKSQTNQSESESEKQSELNGTVIDFVSELKKEFDNFAFDGFKKLLMGVPFEVMGLDATESLLFKGMTQKAISISKCGLDYETIRKELENVFRICELKRIYSQIDESKEKASATPEELKIKANGKVFSIAVRKDTDGDFEFVEVDNTDTLLRAFKGSYAVWMQKSLEAKKLAEVRKMSAENFKQSKRKEFNIWIAEREARGLSTNKTFEDWFALNYE